jgi:hypothetical protein
MSGLYTDVGNDYDALARELSGDCEDVGDDAVAQALGLAQLGFDPSIGDDELGAAVKRAITLKGTKLPAARASGGMSAVQVQEIVKKAVAAANPAGFGILATNPASPQGAFGMKGSMNLLSFAGTVAAGGSLTVNATLDRKSTIRELRAEQASTALRITSFSAAGLPFAALRFPFSLASFGPNVDDRTVRAVTYDASINFSITVSNPTGAAIDMLVEAWGTPG